MSYEPNFMQQKNAKDDRILVLAPMEGMSVLNSSGMTDNRLFSGENKIHAVKDPSTSMWFIKYEQGAVPPQLKQRFTGFKALLKYTGEYFKKRNIEIKEVID